MMDFVVTEKAMRPASSEKRCFYCQRSIGDIHKQDCVLINKKVKVAVIYETSVPAHWNSSDINFKFSDSSWCANNVISAFEGLSNKHGCLCHGPVSFVYLCDSSEPYLNEG